MSRLPLLEVIASRYGLDAASLARHREQRSHEWSRLEQLYHGQLELPPGQLWESQLERFATSLLVRETHFMRHPEQIHQACRIISELSANGSGPLRVWSAGCANGAEPYSLVLTLSQKFPRLAVSDRIHWLASDIHAGELEAARRGRYNEWYFRGCDTSWRQRYFVQREGEWWLQPPWRDRPNFFLHNLISDGPLNPCDLIFCRNVLIHFHRHACESALATLVSSLRPGGYLFLGFSEASPAVLAGMEQLQLKVPHLALYRKQMNPSPRVEPRPAELRQSPAEPHTVGLDSVIEELHRATGWLDQGQARQARLSLKRCLYLEPNLAVAHYYLGVIQLSEGKQAGARRSFSNALRSLSLGPTLPPEFAHLPFDEELARRIGRHLEALDGV